MNEKTPHAEASRKGGQRKPYSRPKLQRYGAIRTITRDVGSKGNTDGGAQPKTKSRV